MRVLLIFFLLAGVCYGQELELVSSDEVAAIEARLVVLRDRPAEVVTARVAVLEKWVKVLPVRRAGSGRISMREYLAGLKAEVERDPNAWVTREITTLEARLVEAEKEVTDDAAR